MRQNLIRKFIFLILAILTNSVSAEIYTGYDQQGKPYYSDQAQTGAKLLALKPAGYTWHTVKHVYDGDTIKLSSGLKVRLAGINTPEIETRYQTQERGGKEAKIALTRWLEGQQVRMEMDVEKKDKYGRTLAHLFTRDQQHLNLELVKKGLAIVNLHPPNLRYQQKLLKAQQEAELEQLGLWNYPEYQPKNIDTLTLAPKRGWQRLLGTVNKIRVQRKFVYLELSEQVDMRIAKQNLDLFPALQEYIGQPIEIRGWSSRRKDHYSILIRHPSAIKTLQGKALP